MAEERRNNVRSLYGSSGRNSKTTKQPPREQKRQHKQRKPQYNKSIAIAVAALVFIVAICIGVATRKNAVEISIGENVICTVKGTDATAEDIKNTLAALIADEQGANVQINEEITLKNVHASKKEIVTLEYALSQMREYVTYKVEAAIIVVDGTRVATMNSEEEAQSVLDSIIAEYVPEDKVIDEKSFVEDVKIEKDFVDAGELMNAEDTKTKLTVGSPATKTYSVASNDTLYKIAINAGITVEELLAANPGLTLDSVLRVGQELSLTVLEPFLSVKTGENFVYMEKQPKQVQYQQDSSQPTSYKKVIQQGQDGQKEVTAQIVRINGFETEEKVISEKITVEPVDEIIVVGTK